MGKQIDPRDLSKRDRGYPYGSDEETRPQWYPPDAASDPGGRRGSIGAAPVIVGAIVVLAAAIILVAVLG